MPADHVAVIESEAARILAAYAADPTAKIPWSDRWSVGTVARHVAGAHHGVARIIEDRPTADFGLFRDLATPAKGDPGFAAWFAAGTAALVEQCRTTPPGEPCWTPIPQHGGNGNVGFWVRHMANETLVHRWDAEAGAGIAGRPMDPARAADGIDEWLDLGVGASRALHGSPAGPAVRVSCTDVDAEWFLDLGEAGGSTVHTEPIEVALTLRGTAEALLVLLYGRLDAATAGVTVEGDHAVLANWTDLVPPL